MKSFSDHLKLIKEVLLYAYIWQIPFSWRIVFDPSRSEWNHRFSEYMDISLYLGEIFIVLALLISILEYKIENKSIYNYIREKKEKLFHVEQGESHLLIVILLIFINFLLSIDQVLSFVSILHYLSIFIFLYLFSDVYVSRGTIFIRNVFFILVSSLLIQCVLSAFQVYTGESIGLRFINEPNLSLIMDNVAKSNIFSGTYLRAYGTFLHPNILAAYALVVAVYSIYVSRSNLFHVKQYLIPVITLVGFTILLSQSKLAILFFGIIVFWYFNEKFNLFHVKQLIGLVILLFFTAAFIILWFSSDAKQSFETRINQYNNQSTMSVKGFLIGSGIGTYRLSYDALVLDWWNYEPVHFVPMIVFKELGFFISLGIFICFFRYISHVPRETWYKMFLPVALILYMSITDHFVWDIYQGSLLATILAFMFIIDNNTNIVYNNFIEGNTKNKWDEVLK